QGRETDRAFYLEAWNGTGSFTCDRIGRGTVHAEAVCLSILGGIQPGPLGRYLRATARGGGQQDDGLVSRLQLLVYPDPCEHWKNVDCYPDAIAKNRAHEVLSRLGVRLVNTLSRRCGLFSPHGAPRHGRSRRCRLARS
ncbi:MAG: DUF3987 domain-containing protein, partial [Gemmatimonadales bacterium]